MNSPPDPGSPALSTPSSGSPPPDELTQPDTAASTILAQLQPNSMLNNNLAGGITSSPSSKRRLPMHPSMVSSSARDPKSRRRDDPRRTGTSEWEAGSTLGPRKEKDDLVDIRIVEQLRAQIGDPFLEEESK